MEKKHKEVPWDVQFIEYHEGCGCCTEPFSLEDKLHIVHCVNSHDDLVAALERANKLVKLLTVRQVIEAGDAEIDAAGLNPWCINEGLAEGNETINFYAGDAALAKAKGTTPCQN